VNYDQCRVVDSDVPDLSAIGLERLISSARPHDTRGGGRAVDRGPRLVLYQNPGFRGRTVTVDDVVMNLGFFEDLAGSAEIIGGRWEFCDRPRLGGNCVTVSDSVRDLRTLNLRGPVASVRPR
jgi:beta/gamma crystallin